MESKAYIFKCLNSCQTEQQLQICIQWIMNLKIPERDYNEALIEFGKCLATLGQVEERGIEWIR